jgi:hypothetical protein
MRANHQYAKGISAILLCAALCGCTAVVTAPLPTATPAPETSTPARLPTASLPSPSSTATRLPTDTPTAIPTPSEAPRPTFTPQPPRIATVNSEATLMQQTYDARDTQIPSFPTPVTCDPGPSNTSISPGGNWLAIRCGYSRPGQSLEIVSKSGRRWVLQFKDYLAEAYTRDGGTPMGGLYPASWSNDEVYLYFSALIAWDGGGTCFYGFGVQGLYRINLNTGSVSITLPTTSSSSGYEYAFSPSGRRLAYTVENQQLVIRDLKTGEEINVVFGYEMVGDIAWSPDGFELVYSACQPTQDHVSIVKSAIRIYSLQSRTSRTILEVEKNLLTLTPWNDNKQLRINNEDYESGEDSYLYYDWSTERFTTPTPQPLATEERLMTPTPQPWATAIGY